MKCPKCGSEMALDEHRKYALHMCYECGYIEGRLADETPRETNFEHLKKLNMNESIAFIASGLAVKEKAVSRWLEGKFKD